MTAEEMEATVTRIQDECDRRVRVKQKEVDDAREGAREMIDLSLRARADLVEHIAARLDDNSAKDVRERIDGAWIRAVFGGGEVTK